MPLLDYKDRPSALQRPEVKGVFVGGCIERGDGSRFRAKAHAHSTGEYAGFICYLSAKRLPVVPIALHELAHILTGHGHTDIWRTKVLEIGGTLDAIPGLLKSYHKKRGTI